MGIDENQIGAYCYKYPRPSVTTDCVVFAFDDLGLKVLLVQRGKEPYKDCWALPGGFLEMEEPAEEGALRELAEETGLAKVRFLKQFHTYTAPERDPRGRVISIAHYALSPMLGVKGGDDAASAKWHALDDLPPLAFDHAEIVRGALEELRRDVYHIPVCFMLMKEPFTAMSLQHVYECLLQKTFHPKPFLEKMRHYDLLEQVNVGSEQPRDLSCLFRFRPEMYQKHKRNPKWHEF